MFEGYENCEFEIMSKFPSSAGDPFQEVNRFISLQLFLKCVSQIASLFTGSTKLFLKLETLENKEKRVSSQKISFVIEPFRIHPTCQMENGRASTLP